MGKALYNENDPYAAQWLRNLISRKLIADGDVAECSIVDLTSTEVARYTQFHAFAGIGGWSYAARLAGWPDDRPVWTGSAPYQPFSLAGKQKGFDDKRHLWPEFRRLIRECRPPVVFGEQVASATEWLRLVRSDLEALGYAVGAIPIQAASAGADHLRDRFWFVGDYQGERRGEGWPEPEIRSGRSTVASTSGMGNTDDSRLEGRKTVAECSNQRTIGTASLADTNQSGTGNVADCDGHGADSRRSDFRQMPDTAERTGWTEHGSDLLGGSRDGSDGDASSNFEWVIGADGKARRVKPGIRLLVDGFPNRVGLLRGFGNAIVPPLGAEFIQAYLECRP